MEMGDFQKFYEKYQSKKVVLLTVNLGESKAVVDKVIKNYGLGFPVLMDDKYEVGKKYNVRAIPDTIIIDKNGLIIQRHSGALTMEQLEQLLNR